MDLRILLDALAVVLAATVVLEYLLSLAAVLLQRAADRRVAA